MSQTDFYTTVNRSMLACVKEVGGMPFVLFQYYLTWETASDGIRPTPKTVCDTLGLTPQALCNLRNILVKKGWIQYENGEVFILKSFRKNEQATQKGSFFSENRSENLKNRSEKMNTSFRKSEKSFRKNESPYKEENKQRINNKNKQEKDEVADTTRVNASATAENDDWFFVVDTNEAEKPKKTSPKQTPTNAKRSEKAERRTGNGHNDKAINTKLRNDLETKDWLIFLATLPEYGKVDIPKNFKKMCNVSKNPTRERFISWLDEEAKAIPIQTAELDLITENEEIYATNKSNNSSGLSAAERREQRIIEQEETTRRMLAEAYAELEQGGGNETLLGEHSTAIA